MQALTHFIDNVVRLFIQPIIVLIVTAGVAWFIWFLATKFLMNTSDAAKRKEGYTFLLWGVIGVFIMVGAIGILRIVLATFNVPLPR